jgi:hypothetical protein
LVLEVVMLSWEDETMASSDATSALIGVVVGGALSLIGIGLQGVNGRRTQQVADEAALSQAHWLHQRKLQESTYFRLAEMVIDVSSHISDASREAKDGGEPALLRFEGAQREAASRAIVEVQVYASPEVRKLWEEWLEFTLVVAEAVGHLVNELKAPQTSSEKIAVAWNSIDQLRSELSQRSRSLLLEMNSEMANSPKHRYGKKRIGIRRNG